MDMIKYEYDKKAGGFFGLSNSNLTHFPRTLGVFFMDVDDKGAA
jgi:hypothetical protein